MYKLLDTTDSTEYFDFFTDVKESKMCSIDLETNSLDPFTGILKLIQIKTNSNIYIFDARKLSRKEIEDIFVIIRDYSELNLFHNAKFDLKFIKRNSGILLENIYDTMIVEQILTAGLSSGFLKLSDVALKYCAIDLDKEVRKDFYEIEEITEEMLTYAALDVNYLQDIREQQMIQIAEFELEKVLDLEMTIVPAVTMMEYNGIKLNVEKWTEIYKRNEALALEVSEEVVEKIVEKYLEVAQPENGLKAYEDLKIPIKTKNGVTPKPRREFLESLVENEFIKENVVDDFNLGSPNQLKRGLFSFGLALKSTAEEVLKPLRNEYPILALVLKFREYNKRATTYGQNYIDRINPITNRLHPEFNQAGTATGRFSSDIQQIPTDEDKDAHNALYRNCFIAEDGYKIVGIDYSQMEYRYVAALAKEDRLKEAFISGIDLHTSTASDVYGKPIEKVEAKERYTAKTLNYSALYGSTPNGINFKNPEISIPEATDLLNRFFDSRPNLRNFIEVEGEKALDNLYTVTEIGRRRWWEDKTYFEKDWGAQSYASKVRREGVNTLIQGGCADIVKIAIALVYLNSPFKDDEFKLLLQVHDELVVEAKGEIAEKAAEFVQICMLEAAKPFLDNVPIEAEPTISDKWEK